MVELVYTPDLKSSAERIVGSILKGEISMKLKHYARTSKFDLIRDWDYSTYPPRGDKPSGFWVSVEGEDDWKSWCLDEEYNLEWIENEFDVALSESANILTLSSVDDILKFTKEFTDSSMDSEFDISTNHEYNIAIRWSDLYSLYDGIIIAPYQWACRLKFDTRWYYGWDVASGCIWNLDAIDSVTKHSVSVLSNA